MQVTNEEIKVVEMAKLQKTVESLILELDAAKLATVNECNKNAVLQNQLLLSKKEKAVLEREVSLLAELRNENSVLKVVSSPSLLNFLNYINFGNIFYC